MLKKPAAPFEAAGRDTVSAFRRTRVIPITPGFTDPVVPVMNPELTAPRLSQGATGVDGASLGSVH